MRIEVSNGEIADKISILQIKLERVKDKKKLVNIQKEFFVLKTAFNINSVKKLYKSLYQINVELWDTEDHIRELEKKQDFGPDFIVTARSIYVKNEIRTELKKKINLKTRSDLFEEKCYKPFI